MTYATYRIEVLIDGRKFIAHPTLPEYPTFDEAFTASGMVCGPTRVVPVLPPSPYNFSREEDSGPAWWSNQINNDGPND